LFRGAWISAIYPIKLDTVQRTDLSLYRVFQVHVENFTNLTYHYIGGHMSYPPTAAFDPVFWLHHCNIDRLLAIWQGIHSHDSDSIAWWNSLPSVDGTFVEPPHIGETPNTNLAPFRKSIDAQGKITWWNSLDTRNHLKLGYDYPQTYAARTQAGGDLVKNLTAWANQELGWVVPASQNSSASKIDLTHFENQIATRVSCFPTQVLVDGVVSLDSDDQYISSLAQTPIITATATVPEVKAAVPVLQKKFLTTSAPTNGKAATGAAASVVAPVTKLASKVTAHVAAALPAVAKPSTAAAIPASITHAPVTIPTQKPTFDQRFGDLGKLVDNGKLTQWNISFGVDQ
jgi:tyrosinase